jgi:GNAT superfamily N-acetyltransferase
MEIRKARTSDMADLQELYLRHLTSYPPQEPQNLGAWTAMMESINLNPDYHLLVGIQDGKIVSSVTLVIIRNLTHNLRPYSVMENVVTHAAYRKRGYASQLIEYASNIARNEHCYKIMLMTGSKRESTLNFYRENGFSTDEKTACLKRL